MPAFIVYDATSGEVQGTYQLSHAPYLDDVMAAHTSAAQLAMVIDDDQTALTQLPCHVVGGVLTQDAPAASEITLADAQAAQSALVEDAYTNATYNTAIGYMGTTFWTDQNSQFILLGAVVGFTAAGGTPAGFCWWSATGTAVAMSLAELVGLYQVIMVMFNANFVRNKTLLAEIAAATTLASVEAIVW